MYDRSNEVNCNTYIFLEEDLALLLQAAYLQHDGRLQQGFHVLPGNHIAARVDKPQNSLKRLALNVLQIYTAWN